MARDYRGGGLKNGRGAPVVMRNRGAHLKRNQQATFDGLPGQTQGSTSPRLSVLLVEDSVDDASLVVRELERGGFVPTIDRVETQAAFNMALASGTWDVIISDYTLPQYSGHRRRRLTANHRLVDSDGLERNTPPRTHREGLQVAAAGPRQRVAAGTGHPEFDRQRSPGHAGGAGGSK